jgi:hypothetical protein
VSQAGHEWVNTLERLHLMVAWTVAKALSVVAACTTLLLS